MNTTIMAQRIIPYAPVISSPPFFTPPHHTDLSSASSAGQAADLSTHFLGTRTIKRYAAIAAERDHHVCNRVGWDTILEAVLGQYPVEIAIASGDIGCAKPDFLRAETQTS
jgi:hypothetical protein